MLCSSKLRVYQAVRHLSMALEFRFSSLSRSKSRCLQSLLHRSKANALRLNELLSNALMQTAA